MIGQKFGLLTITGIAPRRQKNRPRYYCSCDCGSAADIDHYKLISGHTSSCGCAKIERLVKMNRTHGMAKTPEYKSWLGMHDRCYNPNLSTFHLYGGRGILVCPEWKKFENFLSDMGPRPGPGYSIDRIDPNGNYQPKNCRWATYKEQQNNRRNTRKIAYMGEICSVQEISRLTGIPQTTVHRWLITHGKTVDELVASRPC